MVRIALVTPPMSNLNTPYSAVPRLAAWLRKLGHEVTQLDLSLELTLRLYSKAGLRRVFASIDPRALHNESEDVWLQRERYIDVIDDSIALLQGRNPAIALRVCRGDFLPEGKHFRIETAARRAEKFGTWGRNDLARHLVTQMLMDLVDFFRQNITAHFGLVEYGTRLATPQPSFTPLAEELAKPANVIVELLRETAEETIRDDVDLVCFTCPFPGMLFGSLLVGKWLSEHRPRALRALGGGYPSTELRDLSDPRVFDFVDYICLDDGELPLQQICARIRGDAAAPLHKTFVREASRVVFHDDSGIPSPRFRDLPAPDYSDGGLDRYLHAITSQATFVARMANEGTWLKLTAAHGCYWKKCTFCDIHLPYIADFDPIPASLLADQMDTMHRQSGMSAFHFTDEAAPPSLLVNLALELLRRGRTYQFWGNVRFDTAFTPDRCKLLAAAGMVAVTGGIEIASDKLLPKIVKGITVPHVVKVLEAFARSGIVTHAYLIYGFPGETLQDSVDSLETLRQLMKAKLLQSTAYHEFGMTIHSPVGKQPHLFGIRRKKPVFQGFAHYTHEYVTVEGETPSRRVFEALFDAVKEFAEGRALDRDVQSLFAPLAVPSPTIAKDHVEQLLGRPHPSTKVDAQRLAWLGDEPQWSRGRLSVRCPDGSILTMLTDRDVAESLSRCRPANWKESSGPRVGDFARGWDVAFRSCGLVAV